MAAETALQGHAAPPRQLQEAFQLIFTHRKNASHGRVQINCGCFYGAGSALGEAEARGGPSNRARWPAGIPEGRFATFTSIMASESIRREAPGNYQASRHMHANRDGHFPQESGKWLGASIRQIGPGLALSRGGEGGRTAIFHVAAASYGRSRRDLGSQVYLDAAVGEFRARAGWLRRPGASL